VLYKVFTAVTTIFSIENQLCRGKSAWRKARRGLVTLFMPWQDRPVLMALLRLVPGLGVFLEKSGFCVMGDVPRLPAKSVWG
jgi:hypothetical protein